jgi:hypothetical protein
MCIAKASMYLKKLNRQYFLREGFLRSALYLHLFEISVSNADNENRQWQV